MRKALPLLVEQLEDRTTPASFATPWPEASELTLSFAPDGTAAASQTSSLFQTLGAEAPAMQWQTEILRAFQTWAVEANLNVGLKADGGLPFGTVGFKQGDPRFGDIRIGAVPLAPDVLAVADPYDPFVANTWVGDVFLNSTSQFAVAGSSGSYDLFSIMLHEAGHVLGIGHSPDPLSPMFEHFNQVRTGLTMEDSQVLQALYGARPSDAFEGATGNDTFTSATTLDLAGAAHHSVSLTADVTTPWDADVYRLTVPDGATGIDVRLNASGFSLLLARLSVFDSAGHLLASSVAQDPLHNDLVLSVEGAKPGDVLYVKVTGGTNDVFGIGGYHLEVAPRCTTMDAAAPCPYLASGSHSQPSIDPNGVRLLETTPGYVEHTYYEAADVVDSATPAHTYRVRSADVGPGLTNVMTVVVEPLDSNAGPYSVHVTTADGAVVNANLSEVDGELVLQVSGVRSNEDYLIEVRAGGISEGRESSYVIEVDFAQDARQLETFVNDTLGPDQRESVRVLQVNQTQQFHFVLSATDWSNPVETGARMEILDAAGRSVFSMAVQDGASRTGDVLLSAGTYTVRFTRAIEREGSQAAVLFELKGMGLSEPLGPQLRDTTRQPVESTSGQANAALGFYWLPFTQQTAPVHAAQRPATGSQVTEAAASPTFPIFTTTTPATAGGNGSGPALSTTAPGSAPVPQTTTTASRPGRAAAGSGSASSEPESEGPTSATSGNADRDSGKDTVAELPPVSSQILGVWQQTPFPIQAAELPTRRLSETGNTDTTVVSSIAAPPGSRDGETSADRPARSGLHLLSALGIGTGVLSWCLWMVSQPSRSIPGVRRILDRFSSRRKVPPQDAP